MRINTAEEAKEHEGEKGTQVETRRKEMEMEVKRASLKKDRKRKNPQKRIEWSVSIHLTG